MVSWNFVNTGSDNSYLLSGNKPLPEPMLTGVYDATLRHLTHNKLTPSHHLHILLSIGHLHHLRHHLCHVEVTQHSLQWVDGCGVIERHDVSKSDVGTQRHIVKFVVHHRLHHLKFKRSGYEKTTMKKKVPLWFLVISEHAHAVEYLFIFPWKLWLDKLFIEACLAKTIHNSICASLSFLITERERVVEIVMKNKDRLSYNTHICWWPGLLYSLSITLILAGISNNMSNKLWDEITYPFPNFNSCTVEVWE